MVYQYDVILTYYVRAKKGSIQELEPANAMLKEMGFANPVQLGDIVKVKAQGGELTLGKVERIIQNSASERPKLLYEEPRTILDVKAEHTEDPLLDRNERTSLETFIRDYLSE